MFLSLKAVKHFIFKFTLHIANMTANMTPPYLKTAMWSAAPLMPVTTCHKLLIWSAAHLRPVTTCHKHMTCVLNKIKQIMTIKYLLSLFNIRALGCLKAVISFITPEPITCFMVVARYKMRFHVIHFRCFNIFFRSRACNTKLLLIGSQADLFT